MRHLLTCLLFLLCANANAQVTKHADLAYGSHALQKLDLYVPEIHGAEKLPLIVYVHGGGWTAGDKGQKSYVFNEWADTNLVAVASINYRLAPDHIWPAQYDDAVAAIDWIRTNAATYEIDDQQVALTGSSAGGHIAMMVAFEGENDNDVDCVVSFYGAVDLWESGGQNRIQDLLGPNYNEAAADAASPINHVSANDPPLLVIHGDLDKLIPYAHSVQLVGLHPDAVLLTMQNTAHGKWMLKPSRRRALLFCLYHVQPQLNQSPFAP